MEHTIESIEMSRLATIMALVLLAGCGDNVPLQSEAAPQMLSSRTQGERIENIKKTPSVGEVLEKTKFIELASDLLPDDTRFFVKEMLKPSDKLSVVVIASGSQTLMSPRIQMSYKDELVFSGKIKGAVSGPNDLSVIVLSCSQKVTVDPMAAMLNKPSIQLVEFNAKKK